MRHGRDDALLAGLLFSLLVHSWLGWAMLADWGPRTSGLFAPATGHASADKKDASNLQFVDIVAPPFQEEPADARFAAAYDANPAKEMRPAPEDEARGGASGAGGSAVRPDVSLPRAGGASATPPARVDSKPGRDAGKVAHLSSEPDHGSLGVGRLELRPVTEDGDGAEPAAGGSAAGPPGPWMLPTPGDMSASSRDYIPDDIPEGPGKLLRTKHSKFAGFFLRLTNDVEHKWHAREVYMTHDPTGSVYGVKDRYTQLFVKLDGAGKVVDVAVAVSSGLDFLDSEAMSAIRNAAPFHHPPADLADDDGFIRFNFGFYLYVSGAPKVNVYRY